VPLRISASTSGGGDWLAAAAPSSLFLCVVNVAVKMEGLAPASYSGKVTVSAAGQSLEIPVSLLVPQPGSPPSTGSIVNAASAIEGAISPGEMVTIRGDRYDFDASAQGSAGPQIFFDGLPATVVSAGIGQVTLTAPRELAARAATKLEIRRGTDAMVRGLPVGAASPGIFTLDGSGQGPAAVLNQDNTINSAVNPARRGTVVQIFATGVGEGPVGLTIGGIAAQVTYSGPAPGAADGLIQVNAVIPLDARVDAPFDAQLDAAGAGSSAPIVLTAGGRRSQDKVTIAVE